MWGRNQPEGWGQKSLFIHGYDKCKMPLLGYWTWFQHVCWRVRDGGKASHTTPSSSWTPAGYLRIQLRSDTVYPEVVSDSTGWGLIPTGLFPCCSPSISATSGKLSLLPAMNWRFQQPPPTQDVNHKSSSSDWQSINQRFPQIPPLVWFI